MPWQACLAPRLVLALELVRDLLQHLLIRLDALGLDRAPGWRVVARRGQEQRAPVAERGPQAGVGLLVELCDAKVANVALRAGAHRSDLDDLAGEADLDRLALVLALDRELHRGVDRTAQLVDGLVDRHALNRLAVDLG